MAAILQAFGLRWGLLWGLVWALAAASPAAGGVAELLADRSLGQETAPVTIIEYSSLTCPHCAQFHEDILPQIKSAYIDSGKARLIYRDYPLDPRAMAAAMVARCVDPGRYYGFLTLLFKDMQTWARSEDPVRDLKVRAQLAGLPPPEVDACLANQELAKGIEERAQGARREFGIDSTPSFVINGRLLRGAQGFADFRAAIEAALLGQKHGAATTPSPSQTTAEQTAVGAGPGAAGEPGWFERIKGTIRRLVGGA